MGLNLVYRHNKLKEHKTKVLWVLNPATIQYFGYDKMQEKTSSTLGLWFEKKNSLQELDETGTFNKLPIKWCGWKF